VASGNRGGILIGKGVPKETTMGPWIVIAVAGAILSVFGLGHLILQYRRGELGGPHFALLAGLFAIIVVLAFRSLEIAGFAFLVLWIPALIAVHRSRQRRLDGAGNS
jgi:hypothetical protein